MALLQICVLVLTCVVLFFLRFLQGAQGSFCNFPFFYEPSVKAELLKLESKDEQYQEFQTAMIDSLFGAQSCPFLVLKVGYSSLSLAKIALSIALGTLRF